MSTADPRAGEPALRGAFQTGRMPARSREARGPTSAF